MMEGIVPHYFLKCLPVAADRLNVALFAWLHPLAKGLGRLQEWWCERFATFCTTAN